MGLPVALWLSAAAGRRLPDGACAGRPNCWWRQGRLRPAFLFAECWCPPGRGDPARRPGAGRRDPDLDSLLNINEPADYAAARSRAAPAVTIQRLGALADGRGGPQPARAATIAEAAAAAGLSLGRPVLAALNGGQVTRDGELPLVAGDSVAFLAGADPARAG